MAGKTNKLELERLFEVLVMSFFLRDVTHATVGSAVFLIMYFTVLYFNIFMSKCNLGLFISASSRWHLPSVQILSNVTKNHALS